jgi:hypothetical protein
MASFTRTIFGPQILFHTRMNNSQWFWMLHGTSCARTGTKFEPKIGVASRVHSCSQLVMFTFVQPLRLTQLLQFVGQLNGLVVHLSGLVAGFMLAIKRPNWSTSFFRAKDQLVLPVVFSNGCSSDLNKLSVQFDTLSDIPIYHNRP